MEWFRWRRSITFACERDEAVTIRCGPLAVGAARSIRRGSAAWHSASRTSALSTAVEIAEDQLVSGGASPVVCMIVYTNYATDARVRREAETLASHGFRVLLPDESRRCRGSPLRPGGVEVRELGVPKYRGKSHAAYVAVVPPISRRRVRRVPSPAARCGRLDVVHVHNLPDFLVFAGLVPRIRGAKVVLDVHDSIPETFASKFSHGAIRWRALCLEERLSALVAHRVICVNHPQRDALVARGLPASKTFVSMNVPDPRIFIRRARERTVRGEGPLRLVYHGTMVRRLGLDLVIQAVQSSPRAHSGTAAAPLGNRRRSGELPWPCRTPEPARGVHFRPEGYPLEELPARLDAMDIGVVGNRRTNAGELMLPVKLLEYVALGIPVVVPRLRTIAHYFADDMVAYYEPDDVASMAEAIHRLYCRPDLRREQARRADSFLEDHGWDRQGPELVSFYERLLESLRRTLWRDSVLHSSDVAASRKGMRNTSRGLASLRPSVTSFGKEPTTWRSGPERTRITAWRTSSLVSGRWTSLQSAPLTDCTPCIRSRLSGVGSTYCAKSQWQSRLTTAAR